MAELSDGAVIFFGIDPALPAIAAHLQQDGRAVFVRDGAIVLARGPRGTPGRRGRDPADPRRPRGLPGRERAGRRRRGLGAGHSGGADPRRHRDLRHRSGRRALAVHAVRARRQHGRGRRRAQRLGAAPADRRHRPIPRHRALRRLLGRRRPPRRRPDRTGQAAGRRLRPRGAVRRRHGAQQASRRPGARAAAPGLAQGSRVKHIEDEPDHGKAIAGALDAIATGDFVLLQSDEAFSGPTIDLVRRWIQQH